LFGYFQITVLLYYIRNKKIYSKLKKALESYLQFLFSDYELRNMIPKDCEAYLLLIDLIACPWISDDIKKCISVNYIKSKHPDMTNRSKINSRAKAIKKFIARRRWFFDWNALTNIGSLLEKKELKAPY
jgi:hypothetical protein